MTTTTLRRSTRALLFSTILLLGAARAQAGDLIIATNANIIFPPTLEQVTYFYFFTVVDDGGGISTPVITNLGYTFGAVNSIDTYDADGYTYGTFEVAVTVPAPGLGESTSDCFTITYEGESVNPCFDVVRAPAPIPTPDEVVEVCVNSVNGLMRIVPTGAECRVGEYRLTLLVPASNGTEAAATTFGVPQEYRRAQ